MTPVASQASWVATPVPSEKLGEPHAQILIAAVLSAAFVSPALAEDFYVAVDLASGRL
jgi:hypothetical protein